MFGTRYAQGLLTHQWERVVCQNTLAVNLRKNHTYGVWIRWKSGGTHTIKILENSYEFLHAIEGTELENDRVTIWTVSGDKVRINMADVSAYQVFTKSVEREDENPLNRPEFYDNPLS